MNEGLDVALKRKKNMKLYPIHRMLTADLLFYYGIKFLFLTQIKGLSASDIILATAFLGIFKVIFQIPTTMLIDRIGNKRSLIIGDIFITLAVILVMLCTNLPTLIFANAISAIGLALKDVAENSLLNGSIPPSENKGKFFAKIDGKGLSSYYYFAAISAIIAGFLFEVNGYIPMILCTITMVIAIRIATLFNRINVKETKKEEERRKTTLVERYKEYFKDLKLAFSFIFTSRRLHALMLYAGVMYSLIMVMNTYEMGLLDEIHLSSVSIGIIYASMQIICGIAAKKQQKFHHKFKNKTLTIIGISYTLSVLIAGIFAVTSFSYFIVVAIIVLTYAVRYTGTGLYYVLIKKYITNFTSEKMVNKVYSAYGIVTGLGNTLICIIGSVIVAYNSISYSMVIFGGIFVAIMLVVLKFMKTRVGLKPEEYRKKDINYKEYISLK